jgi:hypothetical protein
MIVGSGALAAVKPPPSGGNFRSLESRELSLPPRPPADPPARLRAHAAAAPHRPWIFHPEGWDWRWLSWRRAAERLEALAEGLASGDGGGGSAAAAPGRVAVYPWRPRISALLLDLAIQEVGWTAWPVAVSEEPGPGELEALRSRLEALTEGVPLAPRPDVWVEDPELPCFGGAAPPAGLPRLLPRAGARGPEREGPPRFPRRSGGDAGGGVVVEGAEGPRRLSAAELAAAARGLDPRLRPPGGPGRQRREILVVGRPPADPGERLLLAWALEAGAAQVLVPETQDRVALAIWARPTVFEGDAGELERLAEAAERWRPPPFSRWLRRLRGDPAELPFGRLHTALCRAPSPPEGMEAWRRRGVRVLGPVETELAAVAARRDAAV